MVLQDYFCKNIYKAECSHIIILYQMFQKGKYAYLIYVAHFCHLLGLLGTQFCLYKINYYLNVICYLSISHLKFIP